MRGSFWRAAPVICAPLIGKVRRVTPTTSNLAPIQTAEASDIEQVMRSMPPGPITSQNRRRGVIADRRKRSVCDVLHAIRWRVTSDRANRLKRRVFARDDPRRGRGPTPLRLAVAAAVRSGFWRGLERRIEDGGPCDRGRGREDR